MRSIVSELRCRGRSMFRERVQRGRCADFTSGRIILWYGPHLCCSNQTASSPVSEDVKILLLMWFIIKFVSYFHFSSRVTSVLFARNNPGKQLLQSFPSLQHNLGGFLYQNHIQLFKLAPSSSWKCQGIAMTHWPLSTDRKWRTSSRHHILIGSKLRSGCRNGNRTVGLPR